jgi:hypothetical protein
VASEDPRNLVERALTAGIEAVEETLAEEGTTLDHLFITINVTGQPGGEANAASSASGEKLPEDLVERSSAVLAFLIGHAVEVGKQLGVNIHVAPIGQG